MKRALKHQPRLPAYLILFLLLIQACGITNTKLAEDGKFNIKKDLLLLHYDFKTDVDDLHSVAAFATLLAHPKYTGLNYHAVAGTYGTQKGLYVPPDDLCELAFSENWSNADRDFDQALEKVKSVALKTLAKKGNIWIADGGQSDFSAALVRAIQAKKPKINTKERIHIVQHSDWNEKVTTTEDLAYVKQHTNYHKIPDGNATGNGTPGFRSEKTIEVKEYLSDPFLLVIWQEAIDIGNAYNGKDGRYLNKAAAAGGLDFSDCSEVCWILELKDLVDGVAFFEWVGGT
jgi:hypothetical protein